MDPEEIIYDIWGSLFRGTEIQASDNFFALGGDSLKATEMVLQLESQTGLAIPVGQIFLTPVLRDFAQAVCRTDPGEETPLFIPFKTEGTRRPLFGIAPAKGGLFHFKELALTFEEDQPFMVFEPRVSASGAHPYRSIRHLAEECLKLIRNKQPQGPYRLTGYSFGGAVAWEIARLLEEQQERVDALVLLDSGSRAGYPKRAQSSGGIDFLKAEISLFRECLKVRRAYKAPLQFSECRPLLMRKLSDTFGKRETDARASRGEDHQPGAEDMFVPAQSNLRKGYEPGFLHGSVHLFRATRQLTLHRELDYDLGWSRHLKPGRLRIHRVKGDHFSLLHAPHVQAVGRTLSGILREADKEITKTVEAEIRHAAGQDAPSFPEPLNGESFNDRFMAIVEAMPDKVAVCDGAVRFTFRELRDYSLSIAGWILENHPNGEEPILLHFETSWQFICSVFGVLLAGRCYAPVDVQFPARRIQQIIDKSGAKLGISLNPGALKDICDDNMSVAGFYDILEATSGAPPPALPHSDPEDPAILLFTSGSTGEPKGTVLNRRMLLHIAWRRGSGGAFTPSDRYAVLYVSAFMGAVLTTCAPSLWGCCLVVYNLRSRGVRQLPGWLKEERITVLHGITSVLRLFLQYWKGHQLDPLPDLRMLIPGGEASRASDLALWKAKCAEKVRYCACLGSSECGTISLHPLHFEYRHPGGHVPVGKPFQALGVRVLREDGTEAATGEEGEIVVTSHYIFKGYFNCPELNRKVVGFTEDGKTIYRTGDYGYFDGKGILYNAGRRDSRVKVNGTLVELAEVESVCMGSGIVEEVAVIHRETNRHSAEKQLVAFYRLCSQSQGDQAEFLRAFLMERLPRTMIPAYLVRVTQFPQTPTGKMDRKSLRTMPLPKG